MNLFITVSGCGGGKEGPQGVFQRLEESHSDSDTTFLSYDTVPDDIGTNVQQVFELAKKSLESYQNVYLAGHSMGGAVAAIAACQLNKAHKEAVKGVVLLDSQTEGLHALKDLDIPALFYHGEKDSIFPVWQIKGIFERYSGPKKMVVIEGLDHDLSLGKKFRPRKFSKNLTRDVYSEISEFLLKEGHANAQIPNEIVERKLRVQSKRGLQCLSAPAEESGK